MSNLRTLKQVTRSDWKALRILRAGFYKHGDNIRFVTLSGLNDFKKDFRVLKLWLKRQMGQISYFGVRTMEGLGVVHLVYAGKSVRYGDLSKKWKEITGFWTVSISKVNNMDSILKEMIFQRFKVRYFRSTCWADKEVVVKTLQQTFDRDLLQEIYRTNNGNEPFGGRYIK